MVPQPHEHLITKPLVAVPSRSARPSRQPLIPTNGMHLVAVCPACIVGQRRSPACLISFGFLFWILVLNPKCSCNGGADLGAAAASPFCYQTSERLPFSWIYRIPGSPGWVPRLLTVHQTECFLKTFFENCFIVSPAR